MIPSPLTGSPQISKVGSVRKENRMIGRHLIDNVVLPLLTRLGTMAGTSLIAWGVNAEHANMVEVGVTGLALIAVDLGMSWLGRHMKDN